MPDIYHITEFDELVTVQDKDVSTGDRGQKAYAWHDHSRVWAKIVRNIDEMVGNGNLEDGRSLEAHIYKIPGLSTRWRLLVDGKPYGIRSVDMVSRVSPVCILTLFSIDG